MRCFLLRLLSILSTSILLTSCGGGDSGGSGGNPPRTTSSYVVVNTAEDNSVPFFVGDTASGTMLAPVIERDTDGVDQLKGVFAVADVDNIPVVLAVELDASVDYIRPLLITLDDGSTVLLEYVSGTDGAGTPYNAVAHVTPAGSGTTQRYLDIRYEGTATALTARMALASVAPAVGVTPVNLPRRYSKSVENAGRVLDVGLGAIEIVNNMMDVVGDIITKPTLANAFVNAFNVAAEDAAKQALDAALNAEHPVEAAAQYATYAAIDIPRRFFNGVGCTTTVTCISFGRDMWDTVMNFKELGELYWEFDADEERITEMALQVTVFEAMMKERMSRIPNSQSVPAPTMESCTASFSADACLDQFDPEPETPSSAPSFAGDGHVFYYEIEAPWTCGMVEGTEFVSALVSYNRLDGNGRWVEMLINGMGPTFKYSDLNASVSINVENRTEFGVGRIRFDPALGDAIPEFRLEFPAEFGRCEQSGAVVTLREYWGINPPISFD